MKTSILKKSLIVAALALPLTAFAQPGDGSRGDGFCDRPHQHKHAHMHGHHHGKGLHAHGHHGKRDGMRHVLRGLDLSDAQREQIRQIGDQYRPQMREQAKAMREHRQALRELATADVVDEARLQQLSAQSAQARAEMMAQRVRMQHAILAVLTPEQREAVREKMQQREGFKQRQRPGTEPAPQAGA